jgi:hypothetical protein
MCRPRLGDGAPGRSRIAYSRKEHADVIYGEPEAVKFLLAVRRLKLQRLRRERLAKLAKQKARAVLRKLRPC